MSESKEPATPSIDGSKSKHESDSKTTASVSVIGQPQDVLYPEDTESFLKSDLSTEVDGIYPRLLFPVLCSIFET